MDSALRPTRTRFGVIVFAVMLGIIHYIDRVCFGSMNTAIQRELGLTDGDMKWVFWAFTFAYALFEIPGGWLGDKWGPKRVLIRIVLFWSAFTALTGAVTGLVSLLACRFIFGMGEAGGFPNITKMFSLWLPQEERGVAQGITWMCARWGGALCRCWCFMFRTRWAAGAGRFRYLRCSAWCGCSFSAGGSAMIRRIIRR